MSFENFFQLVENSKYQKYNNSRKVEKAFDFINEPESIDKMLIAISYGKPPLEGIIEEIEALNGPGFDIENDTFLRQAMGSLVKYTIAPFGYVVNGVRGLARGKIFKSASCYEYDENRAKKRLVRKLSIELI